MKNKKLTYILIPIAIIVWGGIILRIVGFNNSDPETNTTRTNEMEPDTMVFNKNEFELIANYRDPFLGKFIRGTHQIAVKKTKKPKKSIPKKIIKTPLVWPHIDYDGSIRSENKVIAVLKINAKKHLLEQGEEFSGLKIKQVYPDSVTIVYKKETKTFPK